MSYNSIEWIEEMKNINDLEGLIKKSKGKILRLTNYEIALAMENSWKKRKNLRVKNNFIDPENIFCKIKVKSKYKEEWKTKKDKEEELVSTFDALWNIGEISNLTLDDLKIIFKKTIDDIVSGYDPRKYIKELNLIYNAFNKWHYITLKTRLIDFLEEKILKKVPIINIWKTADLLVRRLVTKWWENKRKNIEKKETTPKWFFSVKVQDCLFLNKIQKFIKKFVYI